MVSHIFLFNFKLTRPYDMYVDFRNNEHLSFYRRMVCYIGRLQIITLQWHSGNDFAWLVPGCGYLQPAFWNFGMPPMH
jgi:hypothetical protein